MTATRFDLFRVLGITIRVDPSWFFLAIFLIGTLGLDSYPQLYPELSPTVTTLMGLIAALGFFASIILHELGHALVARHYGVETRGITLFLFGGVAELTDEPPHPEAELLIALAGPFISFNLAAWLGLVWLVEATGDGSPIISGIVGLLAFSNTMLAIFNLVPAFPLDGGRVLRAVLWFFQGDLTRATRITAGIGGVFGFALIAVGIAALLSGNVLNGVWWVLLGLFLRGAGQLAYRHVLTTHALAGEKVRAFMQRDPITVPRSISVLQMVEEFVGRHAVAVFPVVDGDRLVGQITAQQLRGIPREEWDRQSVGAVADRCTDADTVSPDDDARLALSQMSRARASHLMVVEENRLVGILLLRDLLAPRPDLPLEGSPSATG